MATPNYDSTLNLVKERLEQIDKLADKFSGFPEIQEKLKSAKMALVENKEELLAYHSIIDKS